VAWTAPTTAISGMVFSAAIFNASVRDNLNVTAAGIATSAGRLIVTTAAKVVTERNPDTDVVGTSQATASTTYVNLATTGPTVTITTGTRALVILGCSASNNVVGNAARMGIDVSGATTSAASDTNSYMISSGNASDAYQGCWTTLYDPINAGSNTFQAKYRAVTAGSASFSNRVVSIMPF
jgi:hypothetical protein